MDRRTPAVSFLGAPFAPDLARPGASFAFLGIPRGVGYVGDVEPSHAAAAPDAVRVASLVYADDVTHFDFDLGAPLFADGVRGNLVECGDVEGDPATVSGSMARATRAVAALVAAGSIPLVIGGDHAITPQVVRGLRSDEPLDVLHVDAHLDYLDERDGVRDGYSSPVRRLRDLPWVRRIVQVGLRDIGSARLGEVEAARAAGNVLLTAADVHARGVDDVIRHFEPGARLYITIDVDGLDPSCAPGTVWPAPGGLWFWQVARIVGELAGRCRLAGLDVSELAPARDPLGHTATAITRLLMIAMGSARRS